MAKRKSVAPGETLTQELPPQSTPENGHEASQQNGSASASTPSQTHYLSASTVATYHTWLAYTAFGAAFVLGSLLHYEKIVENDVAKYPEEWFPSVSSTQVCGLFNYVICA